MAVNKKVERKEEKVQNSAEDFGEQLTNLRFDTVVSVWINSSTIDKFRGHIVVPQKPFVGMSKFTGAQFYALEVYDETEGVYANIKLSKTVMRALVEHGIYSVKDVLGFKFRVDGVKVKILGKDVELPVLIPTPETLNELKKMRDGGENK